MSDFKNTPKVRSEFDRGKGEPVPSKLDTVNDTARAEIENTDGHEHAMGNHMQNWLIERDKLARTEHAIPDFDLGSKAHRNLLDEYNERKGEWDRKADQIDGQFAERKDYIRKNGQTLSDAFSVQKQRGPAVQTAPEQISSSPGDSVASSDADFAIRGEQNRDRVCHDDFTVSGAARDNGRTR